MSKQKLELTWIGKENRPRLKPRILLEDPAKSYHAKHRVASADFFDNRLIFGDKPLARKVGLAAPPVAFVQAENAFKVILYAPRKFADMSQSERIEACYQHAVLKYLSSGAMTNTSLRERFKLAESQRSPISRLIRDALAAGRIRRKDPHATSSKFTEYLPYWG